MGTTGCAVVGYGKNFNFGRMHGRWMNATDTLRLVAVCDVDEQARERASADFEGIRTHASIASLLDDDKVDLAVICTPHDTHAPLAIQCLRAGKHVLVDKAMATSVAECTSIIDAARQYSRKLAVFHNRRYDGNYQAIRQLVQSQAIGEVFNIECCEERYERPGNWWYSSHRASGGLFFFWGPHAIDWVLNLVPGRIRGVCARTQKRLWHHVDVDDEIRAWLFFEHDTTAMLSFSFIAGTPRPLWRILGTQGTIEDSGRGPVPGATIPGYGEKISVESCGQFELARMEHNKVTTSTVPYERSEWLNYYIQLDQFLNDQADAPVSGHEGRRVVAVMEAAQRSALSGQVEQVAYEV